MGCLRVPGEHHKEGKALNLKRAKVENRSFCYLEMRKAARCHRVGGRVRVFCSLVVYKVRKDQMVCASVCLAAILSEHPVVSTTEHRSENSGCIGACAEV